MAARIIATVISGALGFACYKFIGCRTGACPLTSNPYISIIWGALIGFIISG
ncbi:MAG: YtxH domain-containing protein [Candidatus Marinimicrobia bacterium]|nr:YtxH domain-containing protein [Candidatus Neomarinimicrobiota bacterium]MBL7066317.1 YtxH domain-containing protein [Candidatus Neomarinimicrobiota bacterium]